MKKNFVQKIDVFAAVFHYLQNLTNIKNSFLFWIVGHKKVICVQLKPQFWPCSKISIEFKALRVSQQITNEILPLTILRGKKLFFL